MPTKNSTTRFSANGPTVIEGADGLGCWPYASTLGHHDRAQRIADALNEAIENEEPPWVGDGPSVEEAGGGSILYRRPGGDLARALYTWTRGPEGDWEGWMSERGDRLDSGNASGWRRMPKTREIRGRIAVDE